MSTVKGKLKLIDEEKTYGNFRKREFILTTEEKYPQDIKFELYQDDCANIDAHAVGDDLDVSYNLKGNEYKGKYYVNLQAWKLAAPHVEDSAAVQDDGPDLTEGDEELEDVPF